MPSNEIELVPVRAGVCFGRCGAVLLLAYRVAPTREDLRQREALLERIAASGPSGAFLSVVDATGSTPLPDADSRAESTRQLGRYAHFIRAGAIVVRGGGVRVSLLRSFLRGLLIVKSSPFPNRFFDDVGPAARFCLDALGTHHADALPRLVSAAERVERAAS